MSGAEPILLGGLAGAKDLVTAGDTLVKALKQCKGRLLGETEPAAQALGTVLAEVYKTYQAVDAALGQYLGVQFNPDQALYEPWNVEARKELLGLERDPLRARLSEARTHCHKIGRIYDTYLRGWFERVFGPTEQNDQLRHALQDVFGYDSRIVDDLDQVAEWLGNEARTTLDFADSGNLKTANGRILATRQSASAFAREVSGIMADLRALQGDFDRAAGVFGL